MPAKKKPIDKRAKEVQAMRRNESIKPVDLSVFDGFKFDADVGDYSEKRVCIMSALYLATEIALGHTTLEAAIASDGDFEKWDALRAAGIRVNPDARDKVLCVSDVIRSVAIHRNDETRDERERKEWAIRTMPRLLGTYLGLAFEKKLGALAVLLSSEEHIRKWLGDYKLLIEAERATLNSRTKRAKTIKHTLEEIGFHLGRDYIGSTDEFENPLEIAYLDAKLDAILTMAETERDKRDRANAARRGKVAPIKPVAP